ncbi:MAG: hypothetical protein AB3N11_17855, partial [Arenibacterium sp.]
VLAKLSRFAPALQHGACNDACLRIERRASPLDSLAEGPSIWNSLSVSGTDATKQGHATALTFGGAGMERRVVMVRHEHGPMDDRVVSYCLSNGIRPDIRYPFAGDTLGEVEEDVIGTVVYGGNYNADSVSENPFLREEYNWIGKAMDTGIPLLGICQGAQMIAHHQGEWAGARPDETYEYGYYKVSPTDEGKDFLPEPMVMAQAHFHTFDLPAGATHLASSDTYENQAFRIGDKVYGVQFHPEQTIEGFRRWQNNKWGLYEKPGVQPLARQTELMHAHDAAQAGWFYGFLAKFLGSAGS